MLDFGPTPFWHNSLISDCKWSFSLQIQGKYNGKRRNSLISLIAEILFSMKTIKNASERWSLKNRESWIVNRECEKTEFLNAARHLRLVGNIVPWRDLVLQNGNGFAVNSQQWAAKNQLRQFLDPSMAKSLNPWIPESLNPPIPQFLNS